MEAGTALRGLARTALTYKGSFAYRFRGRHRGHVLRPGLRGAATSAACASASSTGSPRSRAGPGGVQRVRLGPPGGDGRRRTRPLTDVAGLPCWPDAPLWQQLRDAAWFRERDADFEDPSPELRAREHEVVLTAGEDYDAVVCGLSIAALPGDRAGAARRQRRLARRRGEGQDGAHPGAPALAHAGRAAELGFPVAGGPITTWLYDRDSPLNVWGDFSELLRDGAVGRRPAGVAELLLLDDARLRRRPVDPFPDQAQADAAVRADAVELITPGPDTGPARGRPGAGPAVGTCSSTAATRPARARRGWTRSGSGRTSRRRSATSCPSRAPRSSGFRSTTPTSPTSTSPATGRSAR